MGREEVVRQIAALEASMEQLPYSVKQSLMPSLWKLQSQLAAIDEAAKKAVTTTTSEAKDATEWTAEELENFRAALEKGLDDAMVDANDDIKAVGGAAVDTALEAAKWMNIGMAGYLGGTLAGAALATGTATTAATVPAAVTTAAATTAATTAGISAGAISSGIIVGLKDLLGKAAMMAVAVFLVTELVSRLAPAIAEGVRTQMTEAAASIEEVEELAGELEAGA